MTNGWIGVDLDGTLAEYNGWEGPGVIGAPIPMMVERVKAWLARGVEVRILTARASSDMTPSRQRDAAIAIVAIQKWCIANIGRALAVTNQKDYAMIELWDDRAISVIPNSGALCIGESRVGL